jgi:hypothetical protein
MDWREIIQPSQDDKTKKNPKKDAREFLLHEGDYTLGELGIGSIPLDKSPSLYRITHNV